MRRDGGLATLDSAEEKLRKLGYRQEFKRDFNMYVPVACSSKLYASDPCTHGLTSCMFPPCAEGMLGLILSKPLL